MKKNKKNIFLEKDYIHEINLHCMHQTKQTKLLMTFFISKSALLKKIRSISKEDIDQFFGFKKIQICI